MSPARLAPARLAPVCLLALAACAATPDPAYGPPEASGLEAVRPYPGPRMSARSSAKMP